ncbi:MAG TPA: Yip1 family protein, partial [Candidatus Izemoplasmatales bacterium]|nr:Yip1 family protein [Candidatus Izemoplasmatales bacterium]
AQWLYASELYDQGDYEQAMVYYEVARDRQGYSEAFWEVRNAALLGSAGAIVGVLIGLIVLSIANSLIHFTRFASEPLRRFRTRVLEKSGFYRQMVFPLYLFRHPADGFYGIKREKKGSNLTALIYLLAFFAAYLLWIFKTNFLYNDHIPSEINLLEQITTVFLPFFLWVVANYLVCSIREGEGKLSDVFQGSAYALLPMIVTFPLLTLISQGLSYNESFIYYTILYAGIALTVVYLIIMVKEIHYYDMKPTIGNILITLFTAIMMLAVIFIVFLLLNEVWNLVSDVIREVISRG